MKYQSAHLFYISTMFTCRCDFHLWAVCFQRFLLYTFIADKSLQVDSWCFSPWNKPCVVSVREYFWTLTGDRTTWVCLHELVCVHNVRNVCVDRSVSVFSVNQRSRFRHTNIHLEIVVWSCVCVWPSRLYANHNYYSCSPLRGLCQEAAYL